MITFIYDANDGVPVSDGDADTLVELLIAQHRIGVNVVAKHSTANVLHALRVAVSDAVILPHEVSIVFRKPYDGTDGNRDVGLRINAGGRIDPWPNGFADFEDGKLMKLVGWNGESK